MNVSENTTGRERMSRKDEGMSFSRICNVFKVVVTSGESSISGGRGAYWTVVSVFLGF